MYMPPWNETLLAHLVTSHCFLCVLTTCPMPTSHTPWSCESMPRHGATAACTCVSSSDLSDVQQRVDPSWDPYHEKRITLGGLVDHYRTIKRGRRVMFVACGTSYHACLACRQTMEELAELPARLKALLLLIADIAVGSVCLGGFLHEESPAVQGLPLPAPQSVFRSFL